MRTLFLPFANHPEFAIAPQRPKTHQPPASPQRLTRSHAAYTPTQPRAGFDVAPADRQNFTTLARMLREMAAKLGRDAPAAEVTGALLTTAMQAHPDSTFAQNGTQTSLLAYIESLKLGVPDSHFTLTALADFISEHTLQLGNMAGGLGWSLPLSVENQQALHAAANSHCQGSVLAYLEQGVKLSPEALRDPALALEILASSHTAQALGLHLQNTLGGIPSDTSVNDYLFTALHLDLDQPSLTEPVRNRVAGFDLMQEQHWGKPAAAVVDGLQQHLVSSGKATPATAALAAHLLLKRVAPEFLVKALPDGVMPGSQAWANFRIAVAKVEADSPGASSTMSYTQLMAQADKIDGEPPADAQQNALLDWGIANGLLPDTPEPPYTPQQLESVRATFNQQQDERIEASASVNAEIPNRKAMALAKLKERYGDGIPFEEKCLKVDIPSAQGQRPIYDPNQPPQALHSMLDIAMMENNHYRWKTDNKRIPIADINSHPELKINETFKAQFAEAIGARKQGIHTVIKHLIAQLPLQDRQLLEHASLSFFHDADHVIGTGFSGKTLRTKHTPLLVQAKQGDTQVAYEIDLHNGKINRLHQRELKPHTSRAANIETSRTAFTPGKHAAALATENPSTGPLPPASFTSARSQQIADAFVEHLDLDHPDILKSAKGMTTHDQQLEQQWQVAEFFLNLIPLRSAITHFIKGNYADGAADLAMDVFSFLTAGAGTAARIGKIAGAAGSTASKALKAAKVIGVATINAFNPLDGVGDLVFGAARLARNTTVNAIKKVGDVGTSALSYLTGSTASYDLIKASRTHGVAATGTFKYADQNVEAIAVQRNAQWYAYDPRTDQAYGPPLKDFDPLYTLDPRSPKTSGGHLHKSRPHPYEAGSRPPKVRKPLPEGEYASAMQGKLEPDHFKPDTKMATMAKFVENLFDHYAAVKAGKVPPRPPIPVVSAPIAPSELLSRSLDSADGVVLGELHNQTASFKTLYDNVETLKQSGVKRVYFEGLLHRPDVPSGLQDDGISMLGSTGQPRTGPTFEELKKKLEDNGIQIMPLDHYYLTRHKDVKHLYGGTKTGFGSVQRLEEFNYYATKTIEATSNGEKWVAVVGNAHMKTSEGVPGLAEMTGSIGIGVFDNKNAPKNLGLGPRLPAPDPNKPLGRTDLPGDLRIYVNPNLPPAA